METGESDKADMVIRMVSLNHAGGILDICNDPILNTAAVIVSSRIFYKCDKNGRRAKAGIISLFLLPKLMVYWLALQLMVHLGHGPLINIRLSSRYVCIMHTGNWVSQKMLLLQLIETIKRSSFTRLLKVLMPII